MNRSFEKELKSLNDDFKNAHESLIEKLTDKIDELESQNESDQETISQLKIEIETGSSQVPELEEMNRNQEEVIKTLLAENENHKLTIANYISECNRLNENIEQLNADVNHYAYGGS